NDQEKSETKAFAEAIAERLLSRLDSLKVVIDQRDDLRPAEKFFHWLQQGIPVRIEVGPRDVAKQSGMVARRDMREKNPVQLDVIIPHVCELLEKIQQNLYQRALEFRKQNTRRANNYDEFREILKEEGGFVMAHWNGTSEVEAQIKTDTKATIRCIPLDPDPSPGKCMVTGEASEREVVFAVAY
ncbi:MAG: His/Gly/Thr/Pro-type tRNA ligase C-terminal domain-containing protein, partial [SAR324 cluster bacterium]|nr:His/Gly/Thr/Pro-type tRNA ligase C-terminal domain-containing protein [SAR324 cluster bacterium]